MPSIACDGVLKTGILFAGVLKTGILFANAPDK
jgi:hypothetical protein